jgi:hypothetical protein
VSDVTRLEHDIPLFQTKGSCQTRAVAVATASLAPERLPVAAPQASLAMLFMPRRIAVSCWCGEDDP